MKSKSMRKVACMALALAGSLMLAACASTGGEKLTMNTNGKKGILVISFGTSYPETRAVTIDACEQKIAEAFPEYEVRRAFTSHIIIGILDKRDGIHVDAPAEALEKMYKEGFSEVLIQPLHIIPGEEYTGEVLAVARRYSGKFEKIAVGSPILSTTENYWKAVDAVSAQLPSLGTGEAVVLMGHGTEHPANCAYAAFQYMLARKGLPVYVGTVEGYPALDDVIDLLHRDHISKVTLMPFMVVAGDHATNDMAGDEDDSWKSILTKEGFTVDVYLHGLGENSIIQNMYIDNLHGAEVINE
jgi:sirohydrochlorin cobaltochelatase